MLRTQQPSIPEIFFQRKNDQFCWSEERGQWLENVDRIHLVLASDKPVLLKSFTLYITYFCCYLSVHLWGVGVVADFSKALRLRGQIN